MAAASDAVIAEQRGHRWRAVLGALRRATRVVGLVFSVLAVMVGASGIVVAVATHFAPEGEYTLFGHPTLIVLSGSMAPAIDTGDLVIDDHPTGSQAASLRAGQVISFRLAPEATPITHRIAAVTTVDGGLAYVTKGDANAAADTVPVLPSQILGTLDRRIPRGGYVLNALHQPLTLGLLLASPALWLLSALLFDWAREADTAGGRPTRSKHDHEDGRR